MANINPVASFIIKPWIWKVKVFRICQAAKIKGFIVISSNAVFFLSKSFLFVSNECMVPISKPLKKISSKIGAINIDKTRRDGISILCEGIKIEIRYAMAKIGVTVSIITLMSI